MGNVHLYSLASGGNSYLDVCYNTDFCIRFSQGLPRSINTDILSKETDGGKSQDFSSFDDTGKSSLGDMFSPVRDGKCAGQWA